MWWLLRCWTKHLFNYRQSKKKHTVWTYEYWIAFSRWNWFATWFSRPTDLQLVRQNMNQLQLHMQRPTSHSVSIHFRKWLEMMSPFCSTIEPQYWQCARMDPENRNFFFNFICRCRDHCICALVKNSHMSCIQCMRDRRPMTMKYLIWIRKITKENSRHMNYKLTSFPNGIPLPSVAVNPITLATRVLNVKYSLSVTPRNIVFISGMPEPILCGATRWTKPAEKRIRQTGNDTHAKYCIYGCDVRSLYSQILAEKSK